MNINLTTDEIATLFDPTGTQGQGGFQSLLGGLQRRTDLQTGALALTEADLERIPRYAFDYGNGGWEDRLRMIFGRSLGTNLGRNA